MADTKAAAPSSLAEILTPGWLMEQLRDGDGYIDPRWAGIVHRRILAQVQPLVDRLQREQAELQQGWLECRQNVLKLIKERGAAEAELQQRDAERQFSSASTFESVAIAIGGIGVDALQHLDVMNAAALLREAAQMRYLIAGTHAIKKGITQAAQNATRRAEAAEAERDALRATVQQAIHQLRGGLNLSAIQTLRLALLPAATASPQEK